ncbi:probable inactive beta-glucosidase 14 isoform X2 [Benincasa hispida]|uniref:probable inactive beta-glucosidase 14 isoform X2 n=1 Tax=Benincasa hispida TaxID=102211 RepID=UPI001900220D|nr:probable inactive beta-glucosidase 14 isoform X2 [Benincasa hispida]
MGTKILQFWSYFFLILFLSSHGCFSQNEEEEGIKRSDFPKHFLFGTATSSYQIEGAYNEDGKGVSNWDVFSHIPGKIKNNDTGDVANNHYHRFLEDIESIHSMGMNSYRFSISWTRILPGIEPFVTIHHFDLPFELDQRYGSWMSSQMQEDFVYFAKICFEEFGDRVKHWITINEINQIAKAAYLNGVSPPGHCSPPFGKCLAGNSDIEPLIVVHNMLLAHAKAVNLYRIYFQEKQGGSIGIAAGGNMYEPLTDSEFDKHAAERALIFDFSWVYDPLVYGDYPKEMREILGNQLPSFSDIEKNTIKESLDYIGINHYATLYTKDCLHSTCSFEGSYHPIQGFLETTWYRDDISIRETSEAAFVVVPRGLEEIINYAKERYPNKPIFITENGCSPPLGNGNKVEDILNDTKRIYYHKNYLASLAKALRNGGDVRGYFVWSLMDNFEWANGYTTRYGLLYVDRHTLKRRPKLSAQWFASFLGGNLQQLDKSSSFLNTNASSSLMDA